MKYIADTGETFTDEDIERWADDVEAGFVNSVVEPVDGRPWEVEKEPMVAKSIRAPRSLWVVTAKAAHDAGVSESEWLRRAISEYALRRA